MCKAALDPQDQRGCCAEVLLQCIEGDLEDGEPGSEVERDEIGQEAEIRVRKEKQMT